MSERISNTHPLIELWVIFVVALTFTHLLVIYIIPCWDKVSTILLTHCNYCGLVNKKKSSNLLDTPSERSTPGIDEIASRLFNLFLATAYPTGVCPILSIRNEQLEKHLPTTNGLLLFRYIFFICPYLLVFCVIYFGNTWSILTSFVEIQ